MLRTVLIEKQGEFDSEGFRLRGKEVTRLEGLTDGVFALAMTLLIVSVEVPTHFDQLVNVLKALPAFAGCFAIMMWLWTTHYTYSRRYGLTDPLTVSLNSALLFVVLFFVYPMKFLFTVALANILGMSGAAPMSGDEGRQLYVLYGAGFASVTVVYLLMHIHALSKREELDLSPVENIRTRERIARHLSHAFLAGASIALALTLPDRLLSVPGLVYVLLSVSETFIGMAYSRKARALQRAEAASGGTSN